MAKEKTTFTGPHLSDLLQAVGASRTGSGPQGAYATNVVK